MFTKPKFMNRDQPRINAGARGLETVHRKIINGLSIGGLSEDSNRFLIRVHSRKSAANILLIDCDV